MSWIYISGDPINARVQVDVLLADGTLKRESIPLTFPTRRMTETELCYDMQHAVDVAVAALGAVEYERRPRTRRGRTKMLMDARAQM